MARTILVIDDSSYVRKEVIAQLETLGFLAIEAHNAASGLEIFRKTPDINLIICDVNMPGMSGLDFAAALKQTGSTVPIVMLSAESSQNVVASAKALGVKAWLSKPLKLAALRTVMSMFGKAD